MARGYPDYEGNKSGLYLAPEWAAAEREDKEFGVSQDNVVSGGVATVNYVVPVGKTLYISQVGFQSHAVAVADRDNNQIAIITFDNTLTYQFYMGGNGGGGLAFTKPFVYLAGQTFSLKVANFANHNCLISGRAAGYEV